MELNTRSPSPRRILLIDVYDDFLDGLVDWFDGDSEIEIIGRAHTGDEAMRRIGSLQPDVVLVDTVLPDGSGLDVTRGIKQRWPSIVVILMTLFNSSAIHRDAILAGADDCVARADIAAVPQSLASVLVRHHPVSAAPIHDDRRSTLDPQIHHADQTPQESES